MRSAQRDRVEKAGVVPREREKCDRLREVGEARVVPRGRKIGPAQGGGEVERKRKMRPAQLKEVGKAGAVRPAQGDGGAGLPLAMPEAKMLYYYPIPL